LELINQLLQPYRSMVLVAGCTGLRISEVLGLRWRSVDFERLAMVIKEGYARSQVTKLKSEYSQDELPLNPDIATVLLEWKRLCPETTGDWVFPQSEDQQSLRLEFSPQEGFEASRPKNQNLRTNRLAYPASQLPLLAGRDRSAIGRSTKTNAPRQHLYEP
jgi:hypothetical protein